MLHWFWIWPLWFILPFHGILTLILVVLIVSLIFHRRHYYYYGYPYDRARSRSDALAILEARYAKGEIQREEYIEKKKDLGG